MSEVKITKHESKDIPDELREGRRVLINEIMAVLTPVVEGKHHDIVVNSLAVVHAYVSWQIVRCLKTKEERLQAAIYLGEQLRDSIVGYIEADNSSNGEQNV